MRNIVNIFIIVNINNIVSIVNININNFVSIVNIVNIVRWGITFAEQRTLLL